MDTEQFDMLRYLSVLPLFSNLSQLERERLAQSCQLKRFVRGDMVFRVGEECDAFYVVVVGQIKLYVASPSGHEKVIEIVSPGHSFAEAMMFLSMPCILNAQALVDTLLLRVSKQSVFSEIERDPRFSMHMLAGISRRLHGLIRDVEGYALHSGMQRLIGYLLREVEDENADRIGAVTVALPVSKATIASRLSLTPEYFSRVLHELEAEGLIEIDKREVRILDVQRLASYGSH
ncbi:MAG: Crp/Fnr family transcriptional regulator [Polaromonas sp.]|uniref:Crp/Fnr family transcriptional regulator n=1 Tax=Polaromonas sp. TaxID=1869339 RepID=UPI00272F5566|nr:Crp/Fnr family transcriptional regulator [Polaromonas sp.]MDP2255327.1 Crp/Fnr family transcriptional regulator [Polaromonas sp.]